MRGNPDGAAGTARRRRRRRYGTRSRRLLLQSLGLTGMALGAAFIVWYVCSGDRRWMEFGAIYLLCSVVVLGVHGILLHASDWEKEKSDEKEIGRGL